jgi:hypothetical protein
MDKIMTFTVISSRYSEFWWTNRSPSGANAKHLDGVVLCCKQHAKCNYAVSTVLGDDADVAGDEGIEGEAAAFRTCCC